MNANQKTFVIENPSPKLLEFVRGLQRQKEESQKRLDSKMNRYFPAKNNK